MRRTDFPPVPPTGLSSLGAALSSLTSHPIRWEQRSATHRFGDAGDDPPADWESAWIDLGGEG